MKFLRIFLLFVFFLPVTTQGSHDIFVRKDGNDLNPGTREKPVATLLAARDLVRLQKSTEGLPKGGITVWIGEGRYDQPSPLELNENDSGAADAPVVWRSVPGGKVFITGGRTLPGGSFVRLKEGNIAKRFPKEAAGHILQVSLDELGVRDFGRIRQYGHAIEVSPAPLELFFNGEAMPLAHYPNNGYIGIGKVLDAGSVPRNRDYSGRGATFVYTDERHARWAGLDDVWLQGTFNYGFADDNLLVQSIDTINRQVRLAMPSLYGVVGGKEFQHYVARNIPDELDSPGEWYLDKQTSTLYFWPPGGMDGSILVVSVLEEPVICLEGTKYLTLNGLTVEAGRGIGIYIERGSHNLITGCTVRNMGTSGIFMGQGARQTTPGITVDDYEGVPVSRMIGNMMGHMYKYTSWNRNAGDHNGVLNCEIYNTGSGGVVLSGGDKRKLVPGNSYVENCRIHDYNRRNKFLWSGINIDGCGNRISHCEIYNSDWQGILVRGNDHLFEYNEIHHVTLNSNDTSPWYIGRDPSDRGNVVRYNYFHHCGNPDRMNMGIYCDDSSTGVMVYGNIFYRMYTSHGVLFSNSGWDLTMENNIIIEPLAASFEISAHYYTWAARERVPMFGENGLIRNRLTKSVDFSHPPYSTRYPELLRYLDQLPGLQEWEGMRSRRNCFARNLIVGGPADPVKLLGGPYARCESDNNFRTEGDPGFADYARQDFNLRPDAAAFQKIPGFKPVPFGKMGLYPVKKADTGPGLNP